NGLMIEIRSPDAGDGARDDALSLRTIPHDHYFIHLGRSRLVQADRDSAGCRNPDLLAGHAYIRDDQGLDRPGQADLKLTVIVGSGRSPGALGRNSSPRQRLTRSP